MIWNYREAFKSPLLPLDVFIGAQQREFNLPYLSRTPFQRQIREKGEDNCSLFYLIQAIYMLHLVIKVNEERVRVEKLFYFPLLHNTSFPKKKKNVKQMKQK